MSVDAVLLCYCPACGDRYRKLTIGESNHKCKESIESQGESEAEQEAAPE